MNLKLKMFFLIVFFSFMTNAKESSTKSLGTTGEPVFYMKAGKMSYGIKESNLTPTAVELTMFNSTIDDLIKRAKDSACSLTIKPNTVEVSMGFVSMSWETKDLCIK